jgi:hypothetical protein
VAETEQGEAVQPVEEAQQQAQKPPPEPVEPAFSPSAELSAFANQLRRDVDVALEASAAATSKKPTQQKKRRSKTRAAPKKRRKATNVSPKKGGLATAKQLPAKIDLTPSERVIPQPRANRPVEQAGGEDEAPNDDAADAQAIEAEDDAEGEGLLD